jgi:hypothetical protein
MSAELLSLPTEGTTMEERTKDFPRIVLKYGGEKSKPASAHNLQSNGSIAQRVHGYSIICVEYIFSKTKMDQEDTLTDILLAAAAFANQRVSQ